MDAQANAGEALLYFIVGAVVTIGAQLYFRRAVGPLVAGNRHRRDVAVGTTVAQGLGISNTAAGLGGAFMATAARALGWSLAASLMWVGAGLAMATGALCILAPGWVARRSLEKPGGRRGGGSPPPA